MGIVKATSGSVKFQSDEISGIATHNIAQSGIGHVPQGRGIFDKLTVEEKLVMGLRARKSVTDEILTFIFDKFPILHERRISKSERCLVVPRQLLFPSGQDNCRATASF